MPPMATGNIQSQQMSVMGLKKFAEHVARPVAGQARIRASAAITGNTGSLARKNVPPLAEWSLKVYYFEPFRVPGSNGTESVVKQGSSAEWRGSWTTRPAAVGINRCS